ncbi:MAG: hypothetical protein ACLGIR_04240 [Actinomycetes bacterium]
MGIDELYGFIIIGVAIVVGRWVRDALREATQEQAALATPPTPTRVRARLDREADAYVDGLVVGARSGHRGRTLPRRRRAAVVPHQQLPQAGA